MLRSSVIRGPAAVWYDVPANVPPASPGTTPAFYTEGDIIVSIDLEVTPVNVSAYGKVDDTVSNIKVDVTFTPAGVWAGGSTTFTNRVAQLWPHLTSTPGTALFASTQAAEKVLVIKSMTGGASAEVYTFQSAVVTKMPSIRASTQNMLCGPVTFSCLRGLATSTNLIQEWTVSDSIVAITAASFSDTGFATSDILRDHYTFYWGTAPSTTVSGFGTIAASYATAKIETLDGFTIDFGMDATPETCDGLGVYDYTLKGVTVTAKCTPIGGPTVANAIAAMKIQATGGARGMSLAGVQGHPLTIVGSAVGKPRFILNNAAITNLPIGFGADIKRLGELTWQANRTWSGGAYAGALATIDLSEAANYPSA